MSVQREEEEGEEKEEEGEHHFSASVGLLHKQVIPPL